MLPLLTSPRKGCSRFRLRPSPRIAERPRSCAWGVTASAEDALRSGVMGSSWMAFGVGVLRPPSEGGLGVDGRLF